MVICSQIVELTYCALTPVNEVSYPIPKVVQRIKAVDNETRLLVVDHETHESLRSLRLTATEEMAVLGAEPPSSSSPPASPSPAPSSVPSSPRKKRENGSVSKQPVQKPTRRSPSKAAKKVSWPSTRTGHVGLRVITSTSWSSARNDCELCTKLRDQCCLKFGFL